MYRTPLGSALVANWQYLILASGPLLWRSWILWVSKDKAASILSADKELIFRS